MLPCSRDVSIFLGERLPARQPVTAWEDIMANMDYPGPCPSCSGIEGCASDASKKDAVNRYCKGLEMELNAWKAQLYDILVATEKLSGDDMSKMESTLNMIKSTVGELEAIKNQMLDTCPSTVDKEGAIGSKLEQLRNEYSKALEILPAGWFGG
jgi:hypothetical protein